MCINIVCENSKCEHYYENMCLKHCDNEILHLNEFGICIDFKPGVNESYSLDNVEGKNSDLEGELYEK